MTRDDQVDVDAESLDPALPDQIDPSIYRYILSHTKRDQIIILIITACSMPFVYLALDVPKTIINEAIGGQNIPTSLFGFGITQISYLLLLSGAFLVLVAINGGFKFAINVYRGVVGERVLRRFRFDLYRRILRFPLPQFRRTSPGEIIPMITSETEPLGGFIGEAFSLPAFQGGLLLTYLFFIFAQDLWLGLAAIALYPPQMWIIPRLQAKVNALGKQRVQTVRKVAERVSETVAGIGEIHAHDTGQYERSITWNLLDRIFNIRYEIYRRKFFIKFLNNFLAQLTPFFFYAIGGYLVITGELSLGALVAVLAAYKDLSPPWKELLKYYQAKEDIRIKYQQIVKQFEPQGMSPLGIVARPDKVEPLNGEVSATALHYGEDEYTQTVAGASFSFPSTAHVALLGPGSSGREDIARLLARLIQPSSGRLTLDGNNMATLPEAVTGQRLGYVGASPHIFTGSVAYNLFYGLKHIADQSEHQTTESLSLPDLSGVELNTVGLESETQLSDRYQRVLDVTELTPDVYRFGIRSRINPQSQPDLAAQVLAARKELLQTVSRVDNAPVEAFDHELYNDNLSVLENIFFGTPVNEGHSVAELIQDPAIGQIFHDAGLDGPMLEKGIRLAEIMLELFSDVQADSELFAQFSFLNAEELPEYSQILHRFKADGEAGLSKSEVAKLRALPLSLIVARHRLGLIDAAMKVPLLDARRRIMEHFGKNNDVIQFFDEAEYHSGISIQDNILFGRIAHGQAHAERKMSKLIDDAVDTAKIRSAILQNGLDYRVGVSGARLSMVQRHKLAVARALIKDPDILILDGVTAALDGATESRIIGNIRSYRHGRGFICSLEQASEAAEFGHILVIDNGQVVQQGSFENLSQSAGPLKTLLAESGH